MMKIMFFASAVLSLTGCAATYKEPVTVPQIYKFETNASAKELEAATKRALISDGNQITGIDTESGIISTAPRAVRLTPVMADCGTTMGLDYLKDNRTSSQVGYGVIIQNHGITIKTNISATYLPGNTSESISMSCVSRGVLEKQLFDQINDDMRAR